MKRWLISVFLSMLCLLAQGQESAIDIAGERASRFFKESAGITASPVLLKDFESVSIWGYSEGGMVVVAHSNGFPIIGYSLESKLDTNNIPLPFAEWIKTIAEGLEQCNDKSRMPGIKSLRKANNNEVLLNTALWYQFEPYNLLCPRLKNNGTELCNTGCTNTATAIVMRYHEWPGAGEGNLPSYSYRRGNGYSRTQPGHSLGHPYIWEKMLLDYSSGYTNEEAMQVAQLIFDCGVMNKAQWNPSNGDTDTANIPPGLITYMFYATGIEQFSRSGFSDSEWEMMIRKELDEGRPIIYDGGQPDGNGHVWVVDGYNYDSSSKTTYFHMNWGWGGISNGFFVISPVSSFPYTERNNITIGIRPDYSRKFTPDDVSFDNETSTISWALAYHGNKGKQHLQLQVVGNDGKGKAILWEGAPTLEPAEKYAEAIHISIPEDMTDSDRLVLSFEHDGKWYPVSEIKPDLEFCRSVSSYRARYDKNTGILTIVTDGAVPVNYRFSETDDWNISTGDSFSISKETFENNGGTCYFRIEHGTDVYAFCVRF